MNVDRKLLMRIGDRIRELREGLGYRQDDVCHQVGISKGFLSDLENGKRNPSAITVSLLADLFDCSTDEIIHGEVHGTKPCKNCQKIRKLLSGEAQQ